MKKLVPLFLAVLVVSITACEIPWIDLPPILPPVPEPVIAVPAEEPPEESIATLIAATVESTPTPVPPTPTPVPPTPTPVPTPTPLSTDDAQFVDRDRQVVWDVPDYVESIDELWEVINSDRTLKVTVKNTGNTVWGASEGYYLSISTEPLEHVTYMGPTVPETVTIPDGTVVKPGETYTFSILVKSTGYAYDAYKLRLQMYRRDVAFGEYLEVSVYTDPCPLRPPSRSDRRGFWDYPRTKGIRTQFLRDKRVDITGRVEEVNSQQGYIVVVVDRLRTVDPDNPGSVEEISISPERWILKADYAIFKWPFGNGLCPATIDDVSVGDGVFAATYFWRDAVTGAYKYPSGFDPVDEQNKIMHPDSIMLSR